jgi:rRNA processing protein Krr1/Pno1
MEGPMTGVANTTMSFQSDLPPLPSHQQQVFDYVVERVRELAAKIKSERLGRFTTSYSGTVPNPASIAPRPRQTVEVYVPVTRASLVVGPQGETMKRLEKMSGASIQLDQSFANGEERRFLVTGLPEDIDEARRLIIDRPLNFSNYPSININVPQVRIGLIIGKGGETIREIQEKSGAKVLIAPDMSGPSSGPRTEKERLVTVMGEQAAVERARDMIEEIVFGVAKSGASACLNSIRNSAIMQIPDAATGAVIGKKAETMKGIQEVSGAKLFVDPAAIPGTALRNVYISGTPESMALAQQLITEKVRLVDPTFGLVYDYSYMQPQMAGSTDQTTAAGADPNLYGSMANMDPNLYASYMAQYYGMDPNVLAQYYAQYASSVSLQGDSSANMMAPQPDQQQ